MFVDFEYMSTITVIRRMLPLQGHITLGPPGPLQLVYVKNGQPLVRIDLIGVPASLQFFVSTGSCQDMAEQECSNLCRWVSFSFRFLCLMSWGPTGSQQTEFCPCKLGD